jgi:hypothetical protein
MSLLAEDKSLLVFPLLSSIAMVLLIASFAIPMLPSFSTLATLSRAELAQSMSGAGYVALFVFYWLQFAIVIFFNTALVEVALDRLDGEEAGVADGLRRAFSLLPVIIAYAFIAATVGTVLRLLAERLGFIGKIIIGLIGFAWSVATALVVPVLAAEDVGPLEAIRRSVELIRKAWGEDIIGNAGLGVVFGLLMFIAAAIGIFVIFIAASAHSMSAVIVLVVLLVLGLSLLALAQATLQGIYSAALYRYANGDPASGNVHQRLLENAFQARS